MKTIITIFIAIAIMLSLTIPTMATQPYQHAYLQGASDGGHTGFNDGRNGNNYNQYPTQNPYHPQDPYRAYYEYLRTYTPNYIKGYNIGIKVAQEESNSINNPNSTITIQNDKVTTNPIRTLSSPYLGPNCQECWRGYIKGDMIPPLYTYWTDKTDSHYKTTFTYPITGTYYGGIHVTPTRIMGTTIVPMNNLNQTAKAIRIATWYKNHN